MIKLILRNILVKVEVLFYLGLVLCVTSCGDRETLSQSNLSDRLRGNTFVVEGLEDVLSDMNASCGDGTETGVMNEAGSVAGTEMEPSNDSASGLDSQPPEANESAGDVENEEASSNEDGSSMGDDLESSTVLGLKFNHTSNTTDSRMSFSTTSFTLTRNGEDISGTWRAIDGDTIRVTVNGESADLDLEIAGDTLTLHLPQDANLNCAEPSTPVQTAPGESEGTDTTSSNAGSGYQQEADSNNP